MTHEEALKPLDSAIWELGEVFKGLSDEDVWVRPHPRLLSIGELAAHVAYGEVQSILGEFESPLFAKAATYYPKILAEPVTVDLGAEALYAEVKRLHEACKAHVLTEQPDLAGKSPHRTGWTWSYILEYGAFHIAYHLGQMYSARHLLGHETEDN
jgi:uncharacterized damage-inducible protein DinB